MSKKVTVTIEMTVPDDVADRQDLIDVLSNASEDALRPLLVDHYKKHKIGTTTVEVDEKDPTCE